MSAPGRRKEDDENLVVNALDTKQGGADDNDAQAGHIVTVPSVTARYGKGTDSDATDPMVVSAPVTSKWAKGSGGPAGDETQNLAPPREPLASGVPTSARVYEHLSPALQAQQSEARGGTTGPTVFVKKHGASTVDDHETWEEDDTARTLNSMGQAGANGALVAKAFHALHGYEQDPEGVQTLLGGASGGSLSLHDAPVLLEPATFSLSPGAGSSRTLQAVETDQATGIGSAGGDGRQNDRGTRVVDGAVRRLTPTECERLQALPDGWTLLEGGITNEDVRVLREAFGEEAETKRSAGGSVRVRAAAVLRAAVSVSSGEQGHIGGPRSKGKEAGAEGVQGRALRCVWWHGTPYPTSQGWRPAEQRSVECSDPVLWASHLARVAAGDIRESARSDHRTGSRYGQDSEDASSDGWVTLVPYEGRSLANVPFGAYTAGDGVTDDVPPDGPRYAACGDAVTATVAEWIADRIARVRPS